MKTVRVRRRARVGSRGFSAVYFVVLLVALFAFVSLAVDIGRVRLARTQLQVAADASARSGADSLPVSSQAVIDASCDAAADNGVLDGSGSKHLGARTNPGVDLLPDDDIEFGIWDPKLNTFTVLVDNAGSVNDERRKANAVHVTGRRISERGDPIPLIFGPVIGVFKSDIEREAIAYITGGPDKFGFIGLDFVRATGNFSSIDSYLPPNKTRRNNGWVASNGNIELGNGDVYGDARPGVNGQITQNPNSKITGWQANLDTPLSYPAETFKAPTSYDNSTITPSDATRNGVFTSQPVTTVPPGTYYFKGKKGDAWTQTGGDVVTITAPADIYLDGDFTMTGTGVLKINASGNNMVRFFVNGNFNQTGGTILNTALPKNLYISVTKPGTAVNLSGTSDFQAHVYAPLSDVTVSGVPAFYGWIVGKSLTFKGTSQLHYDESRDNNVPYAIHLVQ